MSPTKTEEIEAIAALSRQLGPNSYIGPWLANALPYLRAQLNSDLMPEDPELIWRRAEQFKAQAIKDAQSIRAVAEEEARKILQRAREKADRETSATKARAWRALAEAQNALQ